MLSVTGVLALATCLLIQLDAVKCASGHEAVPRDEVDGRLPATTIPIHYNLELFPDFYLPEPPFPFSGHVEIFLECTAETNVIIIHSRGLTIDEDTITVSVSPDSPGSPPDPGFASFAENGVANFLYFHLDGNLVVGERYVLNLDFTGTLRADNNGLYYDPYQEDDGTTRYLVSTQFESIEARTAFPCYDEPDLKATFSTTIVRSASAVALGNMPIISTESRPDGFFADSYATSPVMSSYLVCIGVGDFRPVVSESINGYEVRIWSRPEILSEMQFAADVSAQFQAWLDAETGITYREPKTDHIALPSKGGAMENWGLITYGEESIAINPKTTAATGKLNVASIIAHELAHQWYGNLVTAKWWTEIWLNEGFATHYNYYPTETIGWEPSRAQQIDARRGVQLFYDVDQKNTSDPVRKQINTTWESDNSFDGSTYPKGGGMVRMIRGILTEGTFNRGMTRYLLEHQYTGVTTDDYWAALTAQAVDDGVTYPDGSRLDIKEVMDPWLNQMGYPLITFSNNNDGTATVSRTHFLSPVNQIVETPSQWNYAWHVPITIVTSDSPATAWDEGPAAWINIDATQTTLAGLPLNTWVVINAKQNFFYRVLYDDASLNHISTQLVADPSAIDAESRSAIIDDTFTLSRAGYLSITFAFDNTLYLNQEFVYNAWGSVLKHFAHTNRVFRTETWFPDFQEYVLSQSVPVHQEFGWDYTDTEPILTQHLRRDMVSTACNYGDPGCLATARQQYSTAAADPTAFSVDPNNLPTVLCTGVGEGSSADWTLWLNVYINRKSTQIRDERYAYLFGLSCTQDDALLDRYLDELTVESNIASRDRNTATQYLAVLDYGGAILWNYLDANWDAVRSGINRWTTLNNIIAGFSTTEDAERLNDFIGRHPARSEGERNNYAHAVLLVEQNIQWRIDNANDLVIWLASNPQRVHAIRQEPGFQALPSAWHHWTAVVESYKADTRY